MLQAALDNKSKKPKKNMWSKESSFPDDNDMEHHDTRDIKRITRKRSNSCEGSVVSIVLQFVSNF
jgi:hypothetical protein